MQLDMVMELVIPSSHSKGKKRNVEYITVNKTRVTLGKEVTETLGVTKENRVIFTKSHDTIFIGKQVKGTHGYDFLAIKQNTLCLSKTAVAPLKLEEGKYRIGPKVEAKVLYEGNTIDVVVYPLVKVVENA
jgi:hypothetical protein